MPSGPGRGLVATTGADSFADCEPLQKHWIRSIPEVVSLVCSNNERITAHLVPQVTHVVEINPFTELYERPDVPYSAERAVRRFTG
jgi:hypothetical protein